MPPRHSAAGRSSGQPLTARTVTYYIPYTSTQNATGPGPGARMPRSLGITSLQILGAIRAGEAYGLDIVTRTGLPSGTVYPTLGRLRRSDLIRARWEDQRQADREGRPRRKYYELTGAGARALEAGADRIAALAASLAPGASG